MSVVADRGDDEGLRAARGSRAPCRAAIGHSESSGATHAAQGASGTLRQGGGTDGCPEFHESLVEIAAAAGGKERFGESPELGAARGGHWIERQSKETDEDAGDVSVNDGGAAIEGNGGDRTGRAAADSGQSQERLDGIGDAAGVVGDDAASGGVEVSRAGVVSQAGPESEDPVERSGGEPADGGEAAQEALIVGNDGGDLGLLEHGFGEPDGVRITGASPGQIAVMAVEPFQERACGAELTWITGTARHRSDCIGCEVEAENPAAPRRERLR